MFPTGSMLTKKEICALLLSYFAVKEDINKKRKGDIVLQLEKEIESNSRSLLQINKHNLQPLKQPQNDLKAKNLKLIFFLNWHLLEAHPPRPGSVKRCAAMRESNPIQ
jgi:hypothetical protein